ncbi:MAG: hypothetical protein ACHQUC_05845 [Chlamydiales bacterium]
MMASSNIHSLGLSDSDESIFLPPSKLEETKEHVKWVSRQLDTLIQSLTDKQWSKGHWTMLEHVKSNSFQILEGMLAIEYDEILNQDLIRLIGKISQVFPLIQNVAIEGLQNILEEALPVVAKNLIAGNNFQTLQVPAEPLFKEAWHGESIKSEYLAECQYQNITMDTFLSERSNKLLKLGEYLLRPCISKVNDQREKIDYFVLECRSILTGGLEKYLFKYSHKEEKFSNETGQLFDTFKAFKGSILEEEYKGVEPPHSTSSKIQLRCSQEMDSPIEDSQSPHRLLSTS